VYRVSQGTTSGRPQCLALRLMVDPKRRTAVDIAIGDPAASIVHVPEVATA
jgi:hypothetical protein